MTNWMTELKEKSRMEVEIWYAAFEPKPIHVATMQLPGTANEDVLEPAFEFTQNRSASRQTAVAHGVQRTTPHVCR